MITLYAKYNRERLSKFQIETTICRDGDRMLVKKRSLQSQAAQHIHTMYKNYLLLSQESTNIHLAAATMEGQDEITFEYIHGQSFADRLIDALMRKNTTQVIELLEQFAELLHHSSAVTVMPVEKLFGVTVNLTAETCLNTANIDFTFDNVFCFDGQPQPYAVIDYEWVFEQIPVSYILFRSLHYFAYHYVDLFTEQFPLEQAYNCLGVTLQHIAIFEQVEHGFQQYVYGSSRPYRIPDNYGKKHEYFADVYHNSKELPRVWEWGKGLENTVRELGYQLFEREQEINDYKNSRGYKLLCRYYRVRDAVRNLCGR